MASRRPSSVKSRARTFLRRLGDAFPWTPLGLSVAGASLAALTWFAYAEMDLVLLVVGYGAAALALLSSLATFLATLVVARDLRIRRHDPPGEHTLETELPARTGFRLRDRWWLPLVRVRWMVESPDGLSSRQRASEGFEEERLVAAKRGRRDHLRRRVLVEDVFGLTRLGLRLTTSDVTTALPHIGALRRLPSLLATAGGDDWPHPMGVDNGDRLELRRYAPGDPARFIHWKVFGRTRKLVVRLPERALTRAHRTVLYLVAGQEDEASAAASRVAFESALASRRSQDEDWVFGADGVAPGRGALRLEDALDAIVTSADHAHAGAAGLERFVNEEERRGPASVVLFVPARPGPWLARVVAFAKRRAGRVRLVIGVDGLAHRTRPKWHRRLLALPPAADATSVTQLDEVLRALESTRASVLVIDRRSGRALGEAHRRAVRERRPDAADAPKSRAA